MYRGRIIAVPPQFTKPSRTPPYQALSCPAVLRSASVTALAQNCVFTVQLAECIHCPTPTASHQTAAF